MYCITNHGYTGPSIFLWVPLLVFLINKYDLVVDGGSEDLQTLNVQFSLLLISRNVVTSLRLPAIKNTQQLAKIQLYAVYGCDHKLTATVLAVYFLDLLFCLHCY